MTERRFNPDTALPELPADMRWKIIKRPDGPWENSLSLLLQRRGHWIWWTEARTHCRANTLSVNLAAHEALSEWSDRQAPEEDLTPFIGTYPSKSST